MMARVSVLLCLCFLFLFPIQAQKVGTYKLLFYNVENFFDHLDDSLTIDGEFTPDGVRHWTSYKVKTKTDKIAKVIIAAGGYEPVDFVGFAEIENRLVLDRLVFQSPLKAFNYKILHKESNDRRGIDVALLYNSKAFTPFKTHFIKVKLPADPNYRTRDILYTKGCLLSGDTLHVFVNHWPSRYGGEARSKPLRCAAAQSLKWVIDSILNENHLSNIVVMGDFNDYPDDQSIRHCLGLEADSLSHLINLCDLSDDDGSYKYQGRWGFLDQIMVSTALYERKKNGLILDSGIEVIKFNFLMEKDEKYTGVKPFRTFVGYKYHKGFSDHLPVLVKLKSKQ